MSRLPFALGALLLLGLARLLPASGLGLGLRLTAATLVLLVPGALLARAFGRGAAAGTFVWSLAAVALALVVTFAAGSSLRLALLVLVLLAALALPFALRHEPELRPPGWWGVGALGAVFGAALWRVAEAPWGDIPFHLARVRKLTELDALSLRAVNEFADGGLHPGYAFPLWHGFLALVGTLGGVDPALVVKHEASVLAPLAFLVVFEAGTAVFRSPALGGAVLAAHVGLVGLAAGSGGSFRMLALPGSVGGRQLLVPAGVALFFTHLTRPTWRSALTLAGAGLAIALVHASYAAFLVLLLLGFAGARLLVAREDLRPIAGALGALALPAGAVFLWLAPLVRETASHTPSRLEHFGIHHGLARYRGQLDVYSETSYRLAPETISREGAVAVAALCLVPLAALALRRRWSALVLGGSVLLLAILMTPFVFPTFSDLVSLSQARRLAAFIPLTFAFAGGLAVAARGLRAFVLPAALAAGIALQLAYPGDFGYRIGEGGPGVVPYVAGYGGAVAFLLALGLRARRAIEHGGALVPAAAVLFLTPVAVHGLSGWRAPEVATGESPALVAAVRARVPAGEIVFSDPATSYWLAAYAPVYLAVSEPAHVADTTSNRPYERREAARAFFRSGELAIPRRYGARWLVVDRRFSSVRPAAERVFTDGRYVLYRL